MRRQRGTGGGFAVGALLWAVGCATAPAPPEPRALEVVGLVPWTEEAAAPKHSERGAEAGNTARRATAAPSGGACEALVDGRAVKRSALTRTLDGGLGNWLRGVDVEAKLERGRFQGWLVRGVHAGDPCWAGIDLRAGDVVSRVNRRPIERPEQAQAVWTALRGAGEIVVDVLRARQPHTLRFAIIEDTN